MTYHRNYYSLTELAGRPKPHGHTLRYSARLGLYYYEPRILDALWYNG